MARSLLCCLFILMFFLNLDSILHPLRQIVPGEFSFSKAHLLNQILTYLLMICKLQHHLRLQTYLELPLKCVFQYFSVSPTLPWYRIFDRNIRTTYSLGYHYRIKSVTITFIWYIVKNVINNFSKDLERINKNPCLF